MPTQFQEAFDGWGSPKYWTQARWGNKQRTSVICAGWINGIWAQLTIPVVSYPVRLDSQADVLRPATMTSYPERVETLRMVGRPSQTGTPAVNLLTVLPHDEVDVLAWRLIIMFLEEQRVMESYAAFLERAQVGALAAAAGGHVPDMEDIEPEKNDE